MSKWSHVLIVGCAENVDCLSMCVVQLQVCVVEKIVKDSICDVFDVLEVLLVK